MYWGYHWPLRPHTVAITTPSEANVFQHIAYVRRSDHLMLYVNGQATEIVYKIRDVKGKVKEEEPVQRVLRLRDTTVCDDTVYDYLHNRDVRFHSSLVIDREFQIKELGGEPAPTEEEQNETREEYSRVVLCQDKTGNRIDDGQTHNPWPVYIGTHGSRDCSPESPCPHPPMPAFVDEDDDRHYWHGAIDEVRFWHRGLTQQEIQANMYRQLSPDEEDLVGYWTFDERSAIDSSNEDHNSVAHGDPLFLAGENGYQLVHQFSLSPNVRYRAGDVPTITVPSQEYDVEYLGRVAYFLNLTDHNGNREWIYVSMDADPFREALMELNPQERQVGIPHNYTVDGAVTNLYVASNKEDVPTGWFRQGKVEFWPNSYGREGATTDTASVPLHDADDIPKDDSCCYGSMQIHLFDIDGKDHTLFAWNGWNANSPFDDIGIGTQEPDETSCSSESDIRECIHPDWTYAGNSDEWESRTLTVYVRPRGFDHLINLSGQ